MLRRNSPVIEFVESVLRPEEIVYMVGNRFWAGSKRDRELWMVRVMSWQSEKKWQEQEETNQRQRDWNEVDGENYGVNSRDKVKHIKRNDQLYVIRMMLVAERYCSNW